MEIQDKMIHPEYDPNKVYFDLAVLKTEKIEFTSYILPVCLPETKSTNYKEYDEKTVELLGWGGRAIHGLNPDVLRRASITVFPTR